MKPFYVKIDGKRWRVFEGDPGKNNWACCIHEKREIIVRKGTPPTTLLTLLLHEALHAALPYVREWKIEETTTSLVETLARAGLIPSHDDLDTQ